MTATINPAICALCVDILLLAVIVIFTAIYAKKGFVTGIIELCGTLVSVIAAWIVSKQFSPKVFESFFEENLLAKVSNAVSANQGVLTLEEILNKIRGFLPANIADFLLGDINAQSVFDTAAPDIAHQVVEQIVEPMIVPIISVIMFFAVFAIAKLLINLIAAALTNVNKIPVVGNVNRALGIVVGLLVGVVNSFLLLCVLWAVAIVTGNEWSILNETVLAQSWFFKAMSFLIPFV